VVLVVGHGEVVQPAGEILELLHIGVVLHLELLLLSGQILHLMVIKVGVLQGTVHGGVGVDTLHGLDLIPGNLSLILSCFQFCREIIQDFVGEIRGHFLGESQAGLVWRILGANWRHGFVAVLCCLEWGSAHARTGWQATNKHRGF